MNVPNICPDRSVERVESWHGRLLELYVYTDPDSMLLY